ncbi:MAG: bacterial Ig-like domain-containing protein [Clostridia bacterium]|nr:bacterial Ig-like domain-containing protein [Clostridia bacterium]
MEKNKILSDEKKEKISKRNFSKKGIASLALAGVMITSPLVFAGCSAGKDGADGTVWKSGLSYTEFADAKTGDFFIDTDDYTLYQKSGDKWTVVMTNYGKQGSVGPEGPQGETGTAGATWLTGTIITGKGAGISATIANSKVGDLYFNTTTCDVYQCVESNVWNWISNVNQEVVKAKPVIFDTDFWTDVDDAVAIRVLLWAEQHGMCDIVGLIVDAVNSKSAMALSRFLDYEGRGDLPFALEKDATTYSGTPSYFDTVINSWSTGMYSSNDECIDENNGEYYVELLKSVPEGEKCNIICVGYGSALAGLMNRAEADEDIMKLVKTKVDKIYMMAGKYPSGSENNFTRAPKSRQAGYDICAKTPSEIPIIFLGYEAGESVISGGTVDDVLGSSDLLAKMLSAHGSGNGRSSWDPMTTLLAIYDNPTAAGYDLVQGTNSVNASTGANTFTKNSTGHHYYVTKRYSDKYYVQAINSIVEKNAWEHREVGRVQYNPNVEEYILQSISIDKQPTKTTYITGESFSPTGMVVKATVQGKTSGEIKEMTVTNFTYSTNVFTTVGTQPLIIYYTLNGVTKSTSINIVVNAPAEYSVTVNISNGTSTGATTILQKGSATVTISANADYTLPASITVTGSAYNYNSTTGVVTLSNPSGNVQITASCIEIQKYTITTNLTNGTYSGATEIRTGETKTITLSPDENYLLPESITVTGATYDYNSADGVITLSNPTGDVVISASCIEIQTYTISTNVANGTIVGETEIKTGETKTVTLSPNTDYMLPENITVTGATYEYDSSTGAITLSNPTDNVVIVASCAEVQTFTITTNVTDGTYTGDTEIKTNGVATITITPRTDYSLPTSVTVVGAEYSYDSATGVITLSNATANVEISAVCMNGEYIQIVLDGDENWQFNTSAEPNTHGFYNCYLIDSNIVPEATLVKLGSISTAKYGADVYCSDARFVMVNETRQDTNKLGVGYYAQDPSIYFRFDSSIATSVETFKAWLAANPITIYIKKA